MPEADRPQNTNSVYEAVGRLLPARTWNENPLIWIALVVAVFMAVPFLANWATRDPVVVKTRPSEPAAASAPASAPAQAGAENATTPARSPATANPAAPQALRTQNDPARQMITKCIERGRVVYTQTGECAGSVTAVPIDADKNVVGPNSGASR
jgi:hypothetical protein